MKTPAKSSDPCFCGSGKQYLVCCLPLVREYIAITNVGISRLTSGSPEEAIQPFDRALELMPELAPAHYNLGLAHADSGHYEAAINCFQRAITIAPEFFAFHHNLANTLLKANKYEKAYDSIKRAIELEPDNPLGYHTLGMIQISIDVESAIDSFRKGLILDPENSGLHSALLLALNYLPNISANSLFQEHLQYASNHASKASQIFHSPRKLDKGSPAPKLRIGYVSADFNHHAAGYFIEPVFKHHNKQAFKIYAYYNGTKNDGRTQRLRSYADKWRDIANLTDEEVSQQVRNDNIDILVDLSGHTNAHRLLVFSRKPAPVQISWLGYPNTTGLDTIDYYFTDNIASKEEDGRYFSEELYPLKHGFSCYMPDNNAPRIGPLPAATNRWVTFASLHNLSRLNNEVIALWSKVIRSIPGSRLMILRHDITESTRYRLTSQFAIHGVGKERLMLLKKPRHGDWHMAAYHDVDISLDTFPWSGHTTACEALWMGVPVITLAGVAHASRRVASVLTQVGMSELIATSDMQYVNAACNLASNLPHLAKLRANLRARMRDSILCDASGFTATLERAYQDIWSATGETCKKQ